MFKKLLMNEKKIQNQVKCICNNIVIFEIIPEVECNWGIHTIIQCPKCEELFSIDVKCPAFETIKLLWEENIDLYTNHEQTSYLLNFH